MKMYGLARLAGVFTATGLLTLVALASQTTSRAAASSHISFSESLRFESKTVSQSSGFSSSSSGESVTVSKWNLSLEMPITEAEAGPINGDTQFSLRMGPFQYSGTLKDDPSYSVGKTSAKLAVRQENQSKNTRTVLVAVSLKWDNGKLTAKLESKGQTSKSLAAEDFIHSLPGDINAEAKATIKFGKKTSSLEVPFSGKLKRKTGDAATIEGDVHGEAVTIDIKGDGRD